MHHIHSSAILTGDVRVADDVVIGPYCVIDGTLGPVTIGSGCRLFAGAYLNGPLTLGERNILYPGAALGFAPQDLKWDRDVAGAGLIIGSGNTFREGATIHRATSHEKPTRVGDNNYWMANSHAGHDCTIGNNCIFANGTLLAGHVSVADRVITGGGAAIHQFVRIGRSCMISGITGMGYDLPPFFMLTGINFAGSINMVGMRRSGMSHAEIDTVRWVYKTVARGRMTPKAALNVLRERQSEPLVREYIEFIESSKRGICQARGRGSRESAD